jgi:hypothetical protein
MLSLGEGLFDVTEFCEVCDGGRGIAGVGFGVAVTTIVENKMKVHLLH